MKLSVVIPCYNLGAYLPEAIESVLAQTWQDLEIVIVDDGSTDEHTREVLDHLAWAKTRLVRQENQGLAAARNCGIRATTGEFLCCLDADDRLRPQLFEKALAALEHQADVGLVTSHHTTFGESENQVAHATCGLPELLFENRAIVSSVFRRSAWEQAGGYCQTFCVPGIEDWDLWISIVEAGWRAVVLPEVLFEYRIRPDSMYRMQTLGDPEKYGRLLGELASRHLALYRRYVPDVMTGLGARFASLLKWTEEQERAIAWWRQQTASWQRQVKDRERTVDELRNWIGTLQEGKDWLEAQYANWRSIAEECERTVDRQTMIIQDLEREKARLQEALQSHP